jgi:UDP-N-acetylglucosamine 2-epimerase
MKSSILEKFKLKVKGYYLATIHRAENTDDKNRLKNILDQKVIIAIILGIVIPLIES